jgi:hypothetical protein
LARALPPLAPASATVKGFLVRAISDARISPVQCRRLCVALRIIQLL